MDYENDDRPVTSRPPPTGTAESKSSLGRDFARGCLGIVAIAFLIFVLVPAILFFLKASMTILIPILLIIIVVIGIAFFGRILKFINENWHR